MFHCLYYSATTNESKEKLKVPLSSFSAIRDIVGPSSSSNFRVKMIC